MKEQRGETFFKKPNTFEIALFPILEHCVVCTLYVALLFQFSEHCVLLQNRYSGREKCSDKIFDLV